MLSNLIELQCKDNGETKSFDVTVSVERVLLGRAFCENI